MKDINVEKKLKSFLFERYDPLEKAGAPLFEMVEEVSGRTMTLRPVWIIGDLMMIYEWLNAALCKTNWKINLKKISLMQHYSQMLRSDRMQSFIVEQNHIPVMQVDLLPVRLANLSATIKLTDAEYAIQYIYRESFRDPDIFKRSMEFFIPYVFSFPDITSLYIRIPDAGASMHELMVLMGFNLLKLNNFFGKSLNIYKMTSRAI